MEATRMLQAMHKHTNGAVKQFDSYMSIRRTVLCAEKSGGVGGKSHRSSGKLDVSGEKN